MPKNDLAWHRKDIDDEMKELEESRGFFHRWSELSDVCYTYSRARWSEYRDFSWPLSPHEYYWGLLYMYPKYSLRYLFYLVAGKIANRSVRLHEVRNPRKVEKLHGIAEKNGLDPERFEAVAKKMLRFWPLLK